MRIPRSKYTIFSMKPLHNSCYNGLHSLKRTCDKDKTGNLLSRLTTCRAKDPQQFKEIAFAMVDKQKHNRSSMQREMVVSMLESTTSSLTVKRTRGVLLLTKAECIKHQMNTKHGMTAEKATQMRKTVLDNPDVHRDVEDGDVVIAVRRPTTIDSEEARSRSRQMQQLDEGDAATLRSKLKRKWSNIGVYDSEFADVGGDILRQGASSSRIQVHAVKHTCSILFVVISHVDFEI